MKFCTNCGAQLPDGTKFCSECGQRIEQPVVQAPAEVKPEEAVHVYGQPAQHSFSAPVNADIEQHTVHTYGAPVSHSFAPPVQAESALSGTYGGAAPAAPVIPEPAPQPVAVPEPVPQSAPAYEPAYTAPPVQPAAPVQPAMEHGSYTPPAPMETAKPGFTFGAGGGEKKGLIIGAVVAVVAVIALVVVLLSGGGGAEDPNLGLYDGISCVATGLDLGVEDEWLELKSGGKATLCLMGEEYSCKWTLDGENLTIVQAGDEYAGTLKDGVIVLDLGGLVYTYARDGYQVPTQAPTEAPTQAPTQAPTEAPATEPPATEPPATEPPATEAPSGVTVQDWAGDYYGWWVIDNVIEGNAELEGTWWDCCASFQFNDDGTGTLVIWDEDYTKDNPLASLTISGSVVNGSTARIVSEEGYFMDHPVAHADWLFYSDDTRYSDTLGFSATYLSEGVNLDCYFFLRPWGAKWDDILAENPDFMTFYYDSWYLPLINSGVTSAPTGMVGEAITQTGGAETPTSTVSGDALASADWADCSISIVGAEHFLDSEGKDAIRVYYDFTNKTDETKCAYNILEYAFEQDGYELVRTWSDYENTCPEELNEDLYLRPGASIRCVAQFRMKADGGPVSATIYNYWNEQQRLTVQFDPANLPGRPAQEFTIVPVPQPMWMANLHGEGVYNDNYYIKIETAELTEGYEGGNVLRVYFEFTNNSTEECSLWYAATIYAYQDGIELGNTLAAVDTTEDNNFSTMIKPGETIRASCCFELRTTSPVEIEIEGWSNDSLGTIFVLE